MELRTAQNIAIALCYRIEPYCDKLHIAGSIRRMKPEVKDIEIVALPKIETQYDMFGTPFTSGRSTGFRDTVLSFGKVIKGGPNGKYMQIELPEGVMLDLFIPAPEDFYRQYAIRIGSADYAFKVIANGWKRKGWCGSDKGLRKISDCVEQKTADGKSKWLCVNKDAEKPPVWATEAEFFKWIGVQMVHPSKRNV